MTQNAAPKSWNETSSETQRRRLLEALRNGPKITYELRRLGLFQAPTRVHELRKHGHAIVTSRICVVDQDGYFHRGVALYSLEASESHPTAQQLAGPKVGLTHA